MLAMDKKISDHGKKFSNLAASSSSLATTFSSGSKSKDTKERKVVTTDLHGECTDQVPMLSNFYERSLLLGNWDIRSATNCSVYFELNQYK
jgi:hypothetical protein